MTEDVDVMTAEAREEDRRLVAEVEAYERALERGVPRQLARARYNVCREDAFDQLEQAFVFHWRDALGALRYGLACLLTLRCMTCKHWHLAPYRMQGGRRLRKGEAFDYSKGGTFHCGYGSGWTLKYGWRAWWWAGREGED